MTVCIAAICQRDGYQMVVGASDRMGTAGDIEFELPSAKVYTTAACVQILVAGDSSAQHEICVQVQRNTPGTVRETVRSYCRLLAAQKRKQAERKYLSAFGLSMRQFIERQDQLGADLADRLTRQIQSELVDVAAIICGVDVEGAHIYTVDSDCDVLCHTPTGYAAIGYGGRQAQSYFMLKRYTPQCSDTAAITLTYLAKKRAQVAPGVGETTDMFFSAYNYSSWMPSGMMMELEKAHSELVEQENMATELAQQRIEKYVAGLSQPQNQSMTTDSQPEQTAGNRKKRRKRRKRDQGTDTNQP